ncbi:glycine cleavage system protein R [Halothiobacillus sp. DCM-1]|uniref:glycine cleavage system protein R n=1 Tax=Halothiobacillus sp. DCM-1 TaxID=3112558 RepID=UPI0032434D8B
MPSYLVVTLFGSCRSSTLADLLALIAAQHCRALDSHFMSFDAVSAFALRIGGNWDRLVRVETALKDFAQRMQLEISVQQEAGQAEHEAVLPYVLDAIGLESADMSAAIVRFCARQGVGVRELSTRSYRPKHSSEQLIQLRAAVDLPAHAHLGQFKSDFFDLCDALNLDAAIEPERGMS